jgi:hypothetical protein
MVVTLTFDTQRAFRPYQTPIIGRYQRGQTPTHVTCRMP